MKACDKQDFAKCMTELGVIFNRELDNLTLQAYWKAFDDLPFENIRQACRRAIREMSYFPAPVGLRELAGVLSPAARAQVVWDHLVHCMRLVGQYESVDFNDPVAHAVIRGLGGWVQLAMTPDTRMGLLRKDFLAAYVCRLSTPISEGRVAHLPGRFETENGNTDHGHRTKVKRMPVPLRPAKCKNSFLCRKGLLPVFAFGDSDRKRVFGGNHSPSRIVGRSHAVDGPTRSA